MIKSFSSGVFFFGLSIFLVTAFGFPFSVFLDHLFSTLLSSIQTSGSLQPEVRPNKKISMFQPIWQAHESPRIKKVSRTPILIFFRSHLVLITLYIVQNNLTTTLPSQITENFHPSIEVFYFKFTPSTLPPRFARSAFNSSKLEDGICLHLILRNTKQFSNCRVLLPRRSLKFPKSIWGNSDTDLWFQLLT